MRFKSLFLGLLLVCAGVSSPAFADDDVASLEEAIKAHPADMEAYYNLGTAYAKTKRYPEAIEVYKKAIANKLTGAKIYKALGLAYAKSNNPSESMEAYVQAIRISPEDGDSHVGLGVSFMSMGQTPDATSEFREAVEAYKKQLKASPNDPSLHYSLGTAYIFLEERDAAKQEQKLLTSIDPSVAEKLNALINRTN